MSVYDKLGINEDEGNDPRLIDQIKLKLNQVKIASAQAGKNHDAEETLTIVTVVLMAVRFISQMKPWEATAFGQQLEAYATGQQALTSGAPRPVSPPAVPQAPQQEPQPQNLNPDFVKFLEDLQLDLGLPAIQVKYPQDLKQVLENVKSVAKSPAPSPASSGVDAKRLKQELTEAVSKYDAADEKAEKAKRGKRGYSDVGIGVHLNAVDDLRTTVSEIAKKL